MRATPNAISSSRRRSTIPSNKGDILDKTSSPLHLPSSARQHKRECPESTIARRLSRSEVVASYTAFLVSTKAGYQPHRIHHQHHTSLRRILSDSQLKIHIIAKIDTVATFPFSNIHLNNTTEHPSCVLHSSDHSLFFHRHSRSHTCSSLLLSHLNLLSANQIRYGNLK